MLAKKLLSASLILCSSAALSFGIFEKRASRGNNLFEPDFLLILGCRVKGNEPEETLLSRIEAAADYLSKNKNTKAICCGGIVHEDQTKSEAQAIFEGLLKRGISEERLILEDKSKTTTENFINAKLIIDSLKGVKPPEVAFLSSEFHLLRASVIGRRAGLPASSVPAPSPKDKRLKNYIREFFVFPEALF